MGHLHAMRLGRDLTDMVLSLDQRHPADGLWTAAFTPAHATKFGPANEPAFVKVEDDADGIGLYAMTFEAGKRQDVFLSSIHLPLGRVTSSSVRLRVHWSTFQAVAAGDAYLGMSVQIRDCDTGEWDGVNVTKIATAIPGAVRQAGCQEIVTLVTPVHGSGMLRVRFTRYGNDAVNDTYPGDLVVDDLAVCVLENSAGRTTLGA